jgi:hypothetical protein
VAAQRRASAVAASAVNRVAELIELYRLLLWLSDQFQCVWMRRDDFHYLHFLTHSVAHEPKQIWKSK